MIDDVWRALLTASPYLELLQLKYFSNLDKIMKSIIKKLLEGAYLKN
jgi:hypothetical protein